MKQSGFDYKLRYVQNQYGRQPVFSSFLPGIAGPWGIPAWCNYNNRGQAVCSFGVQDKDHAILEFTAAHTAYQRVGLTGFRTFLKRAGHVTEPFADGLGEMTVEPNALRIGWDGSGFHVEVRYYTLVNERLGGLCRILRVDNTTNADMDLELLDGLAAMVPYGVSDEKLKQEAQLSIAWMQVENLEGKIPYFRVRASMEDTAKVTAVSGGNFRLAFDRDTGLLPAIVDPERVFGWDTAFQMPQHFCHNPLSVILESGQRTHNCFPCCFTSWQGKLKAGRDITLYEFYGYAEDFDQMCAFSEKAASKDFFLQKLNEARRLVQEIYRPVFCRTADPVWDAYVRQNFLDNALRGGLPYALRSNGQDLIAYLYSRKHGDPEREYNYFYLGKEYFSQGNGNFRDICQNRRSDVWFQPEAGAYNRKLFFELLQPDGYNPLVVQPMQYRIRNFTAIQPLLPPDQEKAAEQFLKVPFTVGQLAMQAEAWEIADTSDFIAEVLGQAEMEPSANYQEGYWSDHWTYLLDLVENELGIFPDREAELLFDQAEYRWYAPCALVQPQEKRYCMTENGLRQYHCIQPKQRLHQWVQTKSGALAVSTLAEKMLLLCVVKYASLDLTGAAIEMEGGKPGWYDALNGLPGLLGASVADACELLRLLEFLSEKLKRHSGSVAIYREVWELMNKQWTLCQSKDTPIAIWLGRNRLRDSYREQTAQGFDGTQISVYSDELAGILDGLACCLRDALEQVTAENDGICPTYFYYEATGARQTTKGWLPTQLRRVSLPLFLEGPTRYLKTGCPIEKKHALAKAVKNSDLYDKKLHMYKLNASLENTSFEIGRARAFCPGWLENESIWLHMEYKYLLSLLESGLYEQFFRDFCAVAVPFLKPEVYRRSTLENVSFLVSSANPDVQDHGRGYVARLSGSTAELISIWNQMLFGKAPFGTDQEGLYLRFCPAIPGNLLPRDEPLQAMFLGGISVSYHIGSLRQLIPGEYQIRGYRLQNEEDAYVWISGNKIPDGLAQQVRCGEIKRIGVYFREQ